MRDVIPGAAVGLVVGVLASAPWRIDAGDQPERTPSRTSPEPWSPIPSPGTDLERAVRILARHAGEGWIRCPIPAWSGSDGVREWPHAAVEDGWLVATVAEPEGGAALHGLHDPTDRPPRAIVQWEEAYAGEAGRCRVLAPELVDVPGVVVGRSGRPLGGGRLHGELGPWPVDPDGFFVARCYRGAGCALTAEPAGAPRLGRTESVVVEEPGAAVELVYRPAPRPAGWLAAVARDVVADERTVRMVDPIDLALRDPLMPPPEALRFLRWQERDEAARMSAAGLLEAIAAH